MVKNDFIEKYPDVKVQEVTTHDILSRNQIEKLVSGVSELINTAPLFFEHSGKEITIFTSEKFKSKIQQFTLGCEVIDPNTDAVGVITSDKPFYVCGELCVRVKFGNSSDTYSCDYFISND